MLNQTSSDQELWDAILNDDSKAFALLYERYWLRLYKTACHYIKDTHACEEIVHDVFIIIWNKRKTLQIKAFSAYLNTVTRYEMFRYIKAAKLVKLEYNENYVEDLSNPVVNTGLTKLNELDLEQMLSSTLHQLPKRCREIFYMSKIQQLNNEEIAKSLGVSKHTVENQLTYALKHVKVTMKDWAVLAILVYLLN